MKKSLLSRVVSVVKERRCPDTLKGILERAIKRCGPEYYRKKQDSVEGRVQHDARRQQVVGLCRDALRAGDEIRLDAVAYGPAHWCKSGYSDETPRYYHFLAGMVRCTRAKSIVEVGTWNGGSALALRAGFDPRDEGEVVTIDIADHTAGRIENVANIVRVIGDVGDRKTIDSVAAHVRQGIDILYIDGDHRYEPTRHAIEEFGRAFSPKIIILDDIHWQWSMEKLWAYVLGEFGPCAYDAGTGLGFRTFPNGHGFGVIDLRR